MKLCRFDRDRLGIVEEDFVRDVSAVLERLPAFRWAHPIGDAVIARLETLRLDIDRVAASAQCLKLSDVKLEAPVGNPSKIIGAPVNYHSHADEALLDRVLHQDRPVQAIDEIGCFLKANSALAGPSTRIALPFLDARVDHEGEIAVIIGRPAHKVKASDAMAHLAGYSLALDMTVRGKQDRSLRKSCDSFAVLGPWLTTSDEIRDPADIAFTLSVNGNLRQQSNTALLIRSIPELIEMTSAFYTLYPGDVIMTGTPAGVGPVVPGDEIVVASPQLGRLSVTIGLPNAMDAEPLTKL